MESSISTSSRGADELKSSASVSSSSPATPPAGESARESPPPPPPSVSSPKSETVSAPAQPRADADATSSTLEALQAKLAALTTAQHEEAESAAPATTSSLLTELIQHQLVDPALLTQLLGSAKGSSPPKLWTGQQQQPSPTTSSSSSSASPTQQQNKKAPALQHKSASIKNLASLVSTLAAAQPSVAAAGSTMQQALNSLYPTAGLSTSLNLPIKASTSQTSVSAGGKLAVSSPAGSSLQPQPTRSGLPSNGFAVQSKLTR